MTSSRGRARAADANPRVAFGSKWSVGIPHVLTHRWSVRMLAPFASYPSALSAADQLIDLATAARALASENGGGNRMPEH
jgi:hypothetical protein